MALPRLSDFATCYRRVAARPSTGAHGLRGASPPASLMMDRAGCLLLLTLALPIMILAAAAVAVTSPGPVTVRSASMAAEGRLVFLSQFRTTYCHRGDGRARDNGHSRAVTPVGKVLRLSGIARLPMLTDIWAGRIGLRQAFRV